MSDTRTEPTLHVVNRSTGRYEEPNSEFGPQADQRPDPRPGRRRRRRIRWAVALLILCAGAALWSILWQPRRLSQLPAIEPKPAASAPAQTSQPRYPIEATLSAVPPLDASDSVLLAGLQTLVSGGGIASFLETRNLVRNFVVTVDNLPRRALPAQKLPLKPAAGSFGTAIAGNGLVIGETNARRYAPYVKLLQNVNAEGLVSLYARHYPLFQQAYRELGYPDGHFNDRLVEAIDVTLATPEPSVPLKVIQPKIFYEFADPDLEQLPAGQKIMLRMGRDNAAFVKKRLREIRALVTAQVPTATAEAPGEVARKN